MDKRLVAAALKLREQSGGSSGRDDVVRFPRYQKAVYITAG